MKKKVLSIMMAIAMTMAMTACGGTSEPKAEEVSTTATEGTASTEETFTIGISQFAEHGSLDNCREGFLAGLAEEGIVEGENLTVLFDNSQADMGTASTICIPESRFDLCNCNAQRNECI